MSSAAEHGELVPGRVPAPRVVIVVGRSAEAGTAYRVEAPDRVLRMFGLLTAARDELDLTALPPAGRVRVQRLLDSVRAELDRSVSPALADELHHLASFGEGEQSAAELRLAYASLLGWASGLVVAMLDLLPVASVASVAHGSGELVHDIDHAVDIPGQPYRDRDEIPLFQLPWVAGKGDDATLDHYIHGRRIREQDVG
jgi:Bacterial proteasome activator